MDVFKDFFQNTAQAKDWMFMIGVLALGTNKSLQLAFFLEADKVKGLSMRGTDEMELRPVGVGIKHIQMVNLQEII